MSRVITLLSIVAAIFVGATTHAQIDERCTVTVNGQTVDVNPDGSFLISNIPAGQNVVRVTAICYGPGYTLYGASEFFQVEDGQTYSVNDIDLSITPPPTVTQIIASNGGGIPTITDPAVPLQVGVFGQFSDGTAGDVPSLQDGTAYTASNTEIITVDQSGLVTGVSNGFAFVIASNQGALSVTPVLVALGDPLTTVEGICILEDGAPAVGAEVRLVGITGAQTTTDGTGFFEIQNVPTELTDDYTVRASIMIGEEDFVGTAADLIPVPGMSTDAGLITLIPGGGSNGPMILSGMDPEDHGWPTGPGATMAQDLIEFVVFNSGITGTPDHVLMLGGNATLANQVAGLASAVGVNLTHATGTQIDMADLDPATTDFDAIYMPTTQGEIGPEGLSPADLQRIIARKDDIIAYQNAGGGIAAFWQEGPGAWDWFPLAGLETTHQVGGGVIVTPEGEFILSDSATQVTPFHGGFTGPEGYFGLDVLATEDNPVFVPLIIGGFANIQ